MGVRRRMCVACAGLLWVLISGCQGRTGHIEDAPVPGRRDTVRAAELNAQGLALVAKGITADAERQFRAAIEADSFFGPAHGNLGLVLLQQEKFYEAATELGYACKLMPKASQPRHNLGILYETVGRYDEADGELRQALRLAPDDIEVLGHLARVNIRRGGSAAEVKTWLQTLVVRDEDPAWRDWARLQLNSLEGKQDGEQQ